MNPEFAPWIQWPSLFKNSSLKPLKENLLASQDYHLRIAVKRLTNAPSKTSQVHPLEQFKTFGNKTFKECWIDSIVFKTFNTLKKNTLTVLQKCPKRALPVPLAKSPKESPGNAQQRAHNLKSRVWVTEWVQRLNEDPTVTQQSSKSPSPRPVWWKWGKDRVSSERLLNPVMMVHLKGTHSDAQPIVAVLPRYPL